MMRHELANLLTIKKQVYLDNEDILQSTNNTVMKKDTRKWFPIKLRQGWTNTTRSSSWFISENLCASKQVLSVLMLTKKKGSKFMSDLNTKKVIDNTKII